MTSASRPRRSWAPAWVAAWSEKLALGQAVVEHGGFWAGFHHAVLLEIAEDAHARDLQHIGHA